MVGTALGLTGMAMSVVPHSVAIAMFVFVTVVGTAALAGLGYFEGMLLSNLFNQSRRKRLTANDHVPHRAKESPTTENLVEGHPA
ncbi:MAG: hypothetical protein HKN13_03175 [Rhodothermales bacterium]|nr:hypothetical protein [Rhodothermales bacterium]